jgi:hypothetical protein
MITEQLFMMQSINPLMKIMNEEAHADHHVCFHAPKRGIKHAKQEALMLVPTDHLGWIVGIGEFVQHIQYPRIASKMVASIGNELGL